MRNFPVDRSNGLPGNRLDAYRAGMMMALFMNDLPVRLCFGLTRPGLNPLSRDPTRPLALVWVWLSGHTFPKLEIRSFKTGTIQRTSNDQNKRQSRFEISAFGFWMC